MSLARSPAMTLKNLAAILDPDASDDRSLIIQVSPEGDEQLRRLYEQAAQPEVMAWIERQPDRARQLSGEEIDELLSLQGTGGPLTSAGIEHFVALIERKRRVVQQVHAIAGTDYLELLEKLVALLYEKVQPYAVQPYGEHT